MKIYNVIHADRHTDTTATPFLSLSEAIMHARVAAVESCRNLEDYEEEPIIGWQFHVTYSCEGDHIYVTEHDMEDAKSETCPTEHRLDPIATRIMEALPPEPWHEGEGSFSAAFPLGSVRGTRSLSLSYDPMGTHERGVIEQNNIPLLVLRINRYQYEYLQAQRATIKHDWGIDGAHSNEYCKKCFINKPKEETAMLKEFCDNCASEITSENRFDGGLVRDITRNKIDISIRVNVEIDDDGHICKHCVHDAIRTLDDRPIAG